MQLKEIDKEAAQIEALRPSATATAAAERAHGALLPARARVETYRRALVGQLARAEETYAREVSRTQAGDPQGLTGRKADGRVQDVVAFAAVCADLANCLVCCAGAGTHE